MSQARLFRRAAVGDSVFHMDRPTGSPASDSPETDTGGVARFPPARVGRSSAPPAATPEARNPMRRVLGALRDAVDRLFSPYTTSEQLLDALRRVEGIRTAAEIS